MGTLVPMSTATDMLAAYMTAEALLLQGKEAVLADRRLRLEDLSEIRAGRKEWEARVAQESAISAGAPTIGGLSYSLARLDR